MTLPPSYHTHIHIPSPPPTHSTHRIVALEGAEALDAGEGRGVPHPLQRLPVGDEPHVVHGGDGVEEGDEALLVVRRGEPGRVVEEAEGSSVGEKEERGYDLELWVERR